jgi:hypothetical protein
MLVRFDSKAGTITMFGDVAVKLLRLMGQSGSIPGAVLAPDIPAVVERLRSAVAGPGERPPPQKRNDDHDGEPPVSLRNRALPLIDLLERAAKTGADVTWQQEQRTAF